MLAPSTPMKEERLATSGSVRIACPSACWCRDIAASEVSWAATEMPWMMPVSCTGKKPLGMMTASTTVTATVSSATSRVSGWWRSTTSSQRP